jgi:2-phosphosulfolactate phosphatase
MSWNWNDPVPIWTRQSDYELSFEWGPAGAVALGDPDGIVIVVDVLRFTTTVDAAVGAGNSVIPYRWRDPTARRVATARGAMLVDALDADGPSLSPASLTTLPRGTAVVVPSPNGARCSLEAAETGATVVAASLRNAVAVARWPGLAGKRIAVIAAGERWADGFLRPSIEDLLGAGAVLSNLSGRASPEAAVAAAAFTAMAGDIERTLRESVSGRELIAKGLGDDVAYAGAVGASSAVPVLVDGAFEAG